MEWVATILEKNLDSQVRALGPSLVSFSAEQLKSPLEKIQGDSH